MQVNSSPRFFKNVMIGLVASSAGAFIALPGMAMPEPTETGAEVEAIEEIPAAADTLPTPGADALEADVTEADMVDEEAIAEEGAMDEEAIAEEDAVDAEPVAEELDSSDADTVEAAEIETLSDEAVEASDTMDGEPVVEEPTVDAEPVAEEDAVDAEPVAEEDAMDAEPVAEEDAVDAEPVAAEEINTLDFTIAELTDNSDSFEILAAALAAAELTETLGSEGPFTVFAPTDDAFAALPEGAVEQLLLPENKDVLVQVLTYHVVPGALMSTDLETGNVATVEGSEVAVDIADTVTVNNANVVVADVEASNGVIHIIDRVIIPPSPEADTTETITEDEVAQ